MCAFDWSKIPQKKSPSFTDVNDFPYQVLDDKIFICHIGLSIHSKRGILVEYCPETLGSRIQFFFLF